LRFLVEITIGASGTRQSLDINIKREQITGLTEMIIRPRTAIVTCLLLFILIEDATPFAVMDSEKDNHEGILKKLKAREQCVEDICKRK